MQNAQLLVGIEHSDDAGVYQLNETTALIQTVDFFTPIVDDPYLFGQIAAANSLSDVYAMGGKPITAMNIIGFPIDRLPEKVLQDILLGGQEKVMEAGAVIVGGHTINDNEPKYGLSVTGVGHPKRILTNSGAQKGDLLLLTKPIGTGILATAAKARMFEAGVSQAYRSMAELNKTAAEVMAEFEVHACTDITGFGLLGHTYEMAAASQVSVEIEAKRIPIFADAAQAAAMGLVPAGAYANRKYLQSVAIGENVSVNIQDLCFDPQTSGGLLISISVNEGEKLLAALRQAGVSQAGIIGEVKHLGRGEIYVR
jgi:selenide,water dikinase